MNGQIWPQDGRETAIRPCPATSIRNIDSLQSASADGWAGWPARRNKAAGIDRLFDWSCTLCVFGRICCSAVLVTIQPIHGGLIRLVRRSQPAGPEIRRFWGQPVRRNRQFDRLGARSTAQLGLPCHHYFFHPTSPTRWNGPKRGENKLLALARWIRPAQPNIRQM